MGLVFRKRVPVGRSRRTWLNLSRSGVSASARLGKHVTVNSRGRVTIRLGNGFSWRL